MWQLALVLAVGLPASILADDLTNNRIRETDDRVEVSDENGVFLVYNKQAPPLPENADPIYARNAFLHPVKSPAGHTVTGLYPADHRHQSGIFNAWVNTTYDGRKVDFWNLHKRRGQVAFRNVKTHYKGGTVQLLAEHVHRATGEKPVDILKETWRVTVWPTDGTYRCFDIKTIQTALTDIPLIVNKYHYGGMAVRGRDNWLLTKPAADAKQPVDEPGKFLTDQGKSRLDGNHSQARWVSLSGDAEGQPVSVTVLSHADNPRSPQRVRLHPKMPYFCFAPCVDDSFQIDKEHPFEASYRFLVTDGKPDSKWLNEQWEEWVAE